MRNNISSLLDLILIREFFTTFVFFVRLISPPCSPNRNRQLLIVDKYKTNHENLILLMGERTDVMTVVNRDKSFDCTLRQREKSINRRKKCSVCLRNILLMDYNYLLNIIKVFSSETILRRESYL